MARQMVAAVQEKRRGLILDPRTKLFLLVFLVVCLLGGLPGQVAGFLLPILVMIPCLMLLLSGKWKAALVYFGLYSGVYLIEMFLLWRVTGPLYYLLIICVGLLGHFMPCITMGYFVVTTTTVSEFIASMERMHVTEKITIPLSVLFRFFPAVFDEMSAIRDAMNMRGIRFGGKHPEKILEYRIVPLLICTVKAGDELSAASLTRCFLGPVKRTNVCRIGFHLQDYILFTLCAVIVVLSIAAE